MIDTHLSGYFSDRVTAQLDFRTWSALLIQSLHSAFCNALLTLEKLFYKFLILKEYYSLVTPLAVNSLDNYPAGFPYHLAFCLALP